MVRYTRKTFVSSGYWPSARGVPSAIWKGPPKTLLKRIVPPIWPIQKPKRSKEYNWNDLSDLERLFKKNTFVYALGPVQVDQDEERYVQKCTQQQKLQKEKMLANLANMGKMTILPQSPTRQNTKQ